MLIDIRNECARQNGGESENFIYARKTYSGGS